jgi:hypothetical protein
MRARLIIEGAAFGPEVVRAAGAAFDAGWAEIAERFSAEVHGEIREQLATAIILAAREDSTDADVLRRSGLAAMARSYPNRFASPPTDASGTGD